MTILRKKTGGDRINIDRVLDRQCIERYMKGVADYAEQDRNTSVEQNESNRKDKHS